MHFLDRTAPIMGEDGLAVLRDKTITFAGLGGVGGGAFLALVRCGLGHFRLAENGVFDPPDMNRQAAAFGTTMDRPKLDVYMELARSINPNI
ncbi:MAG: ThiF family adenylyltransferase, partial [Desulfocurvibacter africanus]